MTFLEIVQVVLAALVVPATADLVWTALKLHGYVVRVGAYRLLPLAPYEIGVCISIQMLFVMSLFVV